MKGKRGPGCLRPGSKSSRGEQVRRVTGGHSQACDQLGGRNRRQLGRGRGQLEGICRQLSGERVAGG